MIPGGQKRRGPAPRPPVERFRSLVGEPDANDCHPWLGATQAGGYGRFAGGDGKPVLAHRFAYMLAVGPIPADLTIDHLCRNTSCVNPAHMEVVTREVNAYRGSRNAAKTHCDRGHEFTPRNTYVPPSRPHVRDCRECRRINQSRRYAAKRAAA